MYFSLQKRRGILQERFSEGGVRQPGGGVRQAGEDIRRAGGALGKWEDALMK